MASKTTDSVTKLEQIFTHFTYGNKKSRIIALFI